MVDLKITPKKKLRQEFSGLFNMLCPLIIKGHTYFKGRPSKFRELFIFRGQNHDTYLRGYLSL